LLRFCGFVNPNPLGLLESLVRGGQPEAAAKQEVDTAIDRAVFYAGFADKLHALLASSNPVAGPHFSFSVPEAMGTIGIIAPDRPALLGVVSTILPVIVSGNACVVLAGMQDPRTAIVWAECLSSTEMPSGVVNLLTGSATELASHLAKHREVAGVDAWIGDADLRKTLETNGAENVKRMKTHVPMDPEAWVDEKKGQGLSWIEHFLETKTIWHPVGL
jgi:acyl-CoA reductase-like NAD-dependent aldehyde dehydrogenase